MPKLGLTMEEGAIVSWIAATGESIVAGSPVLAIETDKVETEVQAPFDGVLHQLGEVGETFACGELIGYILDEGEDAPPPVAESSPAAAPVQDPGQSAVSFARPSDGGGADGRRFISPNARRIALELGVSLTSVQGTGPDGRIVSADVIDADRSGNARPSVASAEGPRYTVAAGQLADLLGIEISSVPQEAHSTRISRQDVADYVRSLLRTPPSSSVPARTVEHEASKTLTPLSQTPVETVPLRGMRGTIATRMHQSLDEMAQLTLFMDADLSAVIEDRSQRGEHGDAPGYTDYVIAATARALRLHTIVNSTINEDEIAVLPEIHVGMAVALDAGLIVPVVRNADQLNLAALHVETTRLAEASRTGSLGLEDLDGGTFSVSTLGMFGVDGFTPVVNPPNAAILGVGRLRDDVVKLGDEVGVLKRMTLSLTWDHRVFDGAPAAAFCREIVDLLADPTRLDAV